MKKQSRKPYNSCFRGNRRRPIRNVVWLVLMAVSSFSSALIVPSSNSFASLSRTEMKLAAQSESSIDKEELKQQLQEYLKKRDEANADELAKLEKGKVVGGTKGNKVLDYISGAPVKERIVDRVPNVFDYDELTKYGYSSLVTPIMELGGRRAVYELMEMAPPALAGPPPKKSAPKLVIDRDGKEDKARYSGLKMGQVLNDDVMAEALMKANQKAKDGKELRSKLMEEDFEMPFADKRNTGPRQTPDWTVEKLDEYTKQQGRAVSWAKRAKLGEFVKDPNELLVLSLPMTLYCVMTWFIVAFAFGRSTPAFLTMIGSEGSEFNEFLQAPGLALAAASLGSSIFSGIILAPELNRDVFTWSVKGFCGGPLAVLELRGLEPLITQGELQEQQKQEAKASS